MDLTINLSNIQFMRNPSVDPVSDEELRKLLLERITDAVMNNTKPLAPGVHVSSLTADISTKRKYIVCVDFDGVLHSYTSGWQGEAIILDPPVEGAMGWLADMTHDDRFEICIYSSRSKSQPGIWAMKGWLGLHLTEFYKTVKGLDADEVPGAAQFVMDSLLFPTQKPAASMTIDDRAFCFEGKFPTAEWLLKFKPWNKKP